MSNLPTPFNPAFERDALDFKAVSERLEQDMDAFLKSLLPVLDKVEQTCRDIDQKTPDQIGNCVQMLSMLPDIVDQAASLIGLESFGTPGDQAQPLRHEIKDTRPTDQAHGTILDVVQCGWEYDGRILRRALVIASDNPGSR